MATRRDGDWSNRLHHPPVPSEDQIMRDLHNCNTWALVLFGSAPPRAAKNPQT